MGAAGPLSFVADPSKETEWRECITDLAQCPNVHMKVGGLQVSLSLSFWGIPKMGWWGHLFGCFSRCFNNFLSWICRWSAMDLNLVLLPTLMVRRNSPFITS
jgi:hypothetical protein